MPSPLLIPAIISGASAAVNAGSTALNNRAARKYADKAYARQRADNLADWDMQNEYNHPSNQMARFRDAGLNPHLVYGQSNEGATLKHTEQQTWKPEAPQVGNVGLDMYDMVMREAQVDNLRTQNTVLEEERKLKTAQTAATLVGAATSNFDLGQKNRLKDVYVETATAELEKLHKEVTKLQADTKYTLNQDERAAAMNAKNIEEATSRIVSMRIQNAKTEQERQNLVVALNNMKKDGVLKDWDIKLREAGIHPGDPGYWRVINKVLEMLPGHEVPDKGVRTEAIRRGGKNASLMRAMRPLW